MPKFKIRHLTKYKYEVPVRDSANQIMLYPIMDEFQEVTSHSMSISNNPVVDMHKDYYGNQIGTFTNSQPHDHLIIDSRLSITTYEQQLPNVTATTEQQWAELKNIKYKIPYVDFLKHENFEAIADIEKVIDADKEKNTSPLDSAKYFCDFVFNNFRYKKGITTIESTVDEIWHIKSGVCQDFAHILLVLLRLREIPARYVSGYICANKSGMRGEGATHAWVEAYIPFYGWLGFDPTNNSIATETHVRLAVGRNFTDCSPVKGTYRGTSDHTLEVVVSVAYEDGKLTEENSEHVVEEPFTSQGRNSFRRFQEMQIQQQQQQQQQEI